MTDNHENKASSEIDHRPRLTSQQTWERLFETQLPHRHIATEIAQEILNAYANIGLFGQVNTVGDRFLNFNGEEVNRTNVISMPFIPGTEPYSLLDLHFFKNENPRAIKVIDKKAILMLEDKLREADILRDNGVLAGTVLFTHKEITFIRPRSANGIGIGVVDKDTAKPLGIVFCSEEMLPFMFDDSEGPKRTRKKKEIFVKTPQLVPVSGGVEI
jgi:hypothetical protein